MLSENNFNWSHANNIKTRPWLNHGGFFCAYLLEGTWLNKDESNSSLRDRFVYPANGLWISDRFENVRRAASCYHAYSLGAEASMGVLYERLKAQQI